MSERKPLREEHWFGVAGSFPRTLLRLHWEIPAIVGTPWVVDFDVFPVIAYDMNDTPEFYASESQELSGGLTQDIEKAFPECHGFVKWDGCTQIYFEADRNMPALHFDDADGMRHFFEVLTFARGRATLQMPEAD